MTKGIDETSDVRPGRMPSGVRTQTPSGLNMDAKQLTEQE